jgi:hypothetical protein
LLLGEHDFALDVFVGLGVLLEVLFTGDLEHLLMLNRNVLLLVLLEGHVSQLILVILLVESKSIAFASLLDLGDPCLVCLICLQLPVVGQPSFETNVEVHNSKERIDRLRFTSKQRNDNLLGSFDASDVQDSLLYFVLRVDLLNLQLFVQRKVTKVSFHGPVKQFVEVDVSIFRFDTHLKHLSLQI